MTAERHILNLVCPNRPGIVAVVSTRLFEAGANIAESNQFDDVATGRFFMRVVFNFVREDADLVRLQAELAVVARDLAMDWTLRADRDRQRVLILASRFDHCLADLLYRWRIGELRMEITGIVSNHPRSAFAHLDMGDLPFHHLPADRINKAPQEAQIWSLVQSTRTDLVVLARYMQILTAELVERLPGRCINIHHSFLPSFKGAKPYHQAHARGVKLIGATAHYVTANLDEGPIIEQAVERVSHQDSPEDLVRKGRDIERRVLAQAVRLHLDGRVLLNGSKTVVFRD